MLAVVTTLIFEAAEVAGLSLQLPETGIGVYDWAVFLKVKCRCEQLYTQQELLIMKVTDLAASRALQEELSVRTTERML